VLVDDLNKSDVRSSPSAALSTPFLCLTLDEQTIVAHTYFQLVDQAPPHCPLWPGAALRLIRFRAPALYSLTCFAFDLQVAVGLVCCRFGACAAYLRFFRDVHTYQEYPGRRIQRPCPLDGRFVRMIFVETLPLGFLSSKMHIPKNWQWF
jgi:hypothetical protein